MRGAGIYRPKRTGVCTGGIIRNAKCATMKREVFPSVFVSSSLSFSEISDLSLQPAFSAALSRRALQVSMALVRLFSASQPLLLLSLAHRSVAPIAPPDVGT